MSAANASSGGVPGGSTSAPGGSDIASGSASAPGGSAMVSGSAVVLVGRAVAGSNIVLVGPATRSGTVSAAGPGAFSAVYWSGSRISTSRSSPAAWSAAVPGPDTGVSRTASPS